MGHVFLQPIRETVTVENKDNYPHVGEKTDAGVQELGLIFAAQSFVFKQK